MRCADRQRRRVAIILIDLLELSRYRVNANSETFRLWRLLCLSVCLLETTSRRVGVERRSSTLTWRDCFRMAAGYVRARNALCRVTAEKRLWSGASNLPTCLPTYLVAEGDGATAAWLKMPQLGTTAEKKSDQPPSTFAPTTDEGTDGRRKDARTEVRKERKRGEPDCNADWPVG